jgi:RHS repeat-associated protein
VDSLSFHLVQISPVTSTNALGRTTRFNYNPLNQILQITDPLQGNTSFTYDLNGNLLTVQDANQGTTTYTYNDHDLVATRTDPVQRTESYAYDPNDNLATFTDRKGQVTTYTYDNLNRLNFAGFGTQGNNYASTISYQYDAGNRMTQATDSISGVVTRGFDGLDRLTSETTPQGSISYTYDAASRRATMQVAGQSQVGYTFDNGNRLTQIAQGTSTVGFSYDNMNRRSTLTLPNGIVATYSYDNDSNLTGIAYSLNSTSVGSLTYGYDALGMRNSATGSFARTGLPQPVPSASYDTANELLAWNESAPSYDSNGNMLSDGIHSYAWDARNHLSTIDSGSTGSFVYDPAGRRATKVISGTGTNFLYDLANPVQELSGTTPTANLLTGGLDQYFVRTDSAGTRNFLTDALGSTAALTDSAGTIQTQYTFDPFGNTTVSGAASSNPSQYTGRENELNGLHFYRNRYYSPVLHRFINQDPMGFAGSGPNLYAYVFDSPTNLVDPFGLEGEWWNPHSYDFSHYNPWDTVQDVGNVAEAFTDTITFGSASRLNDALGAGGMVDRCGIGHKLGTAAGIVTSIVIIPNIASWAKNPILYEVGSTTVPSAVYEGMQGMNAVQKGGYLLSNYGWMGTLKLAGQAALDLEHVGTIGTGLTPPGWLAVIGASNATSSLTKPKCGCQ